MNAGKVLVLISILTGFSVHFSVSFGQKFDLKEAAHQLSSFHFNQNNNPDKEGSESEFQKGEENEEYDGPDKAALFEFQRTKDPALGSVPRERLIRAMERVRQSKARVLSSGLLNLNRSSSISMSWIERGPNADVVGTSNGNTRANNGVTAGRVRAVMVDSGDAARKTVWVGGVDGGLWKTTDITASPANWVPVNDFLSNLAVTDICQNPRGNGDTMYFCTGEAYYNFDAVKGNGVFKSTDHGITWTQLSSTVSYGYCTRIRCDYQGNIYLATRGNGLLRSVNGGSSWTSITPSGLVSDICDLEISSTAGPARLHMVSGIFSTQSYRYTDNPATVSSGSGWNAPATAFPSYSMRAEMACRGNTLYVLPANGSYEVPVIYKSTDGGANWSSTAGQPSSGWASGQGWYALAIDINPANTNQVIIGGLDAYKTTDGGNSWSIISNWYGTTGQYVHADIHNITWYDGGNKLIFGCDGGIHFSSDKGGTIRDRNTGLRIKQFYSCAIHPTLSDFMLAGAQDNGVHLLNGSGLTSSTEVTGGDGAFVSIDQDQPAVQFGSYVYNAYRKSTNTGSTWNSFSFYKGSGGNDFGSFINPFDYDNSANILYAGADAGEFFRWKTNTLTTPGTYYSSSFPSGVSIVSGQTGMNGSKVSAVCVSPFTPHKVFFGTAAGRIVYVNRADTATLSTSSVNITGSGMPGGNVSCIALGSSDRHLLACYSNYGITNLWVSYNGGSSWTGIDGDLPDMPLRWCMFYPGDSTRAIIATEGGVMSTDQINGSSTIWNASPSFPIVRTDMLKYRSSDGTLVAATHGRGLWTATLSACTPATISVSSNSPVCNGQTLSFTGASDQPSATYSWSGPNGFTSASLSPSISNASTSASGTYILTALYNGCTSTASITVAVNSPPVISASSNSPLCQGQTLVLTAGSNQPGSSFSWTGPNGFSSFSQNPSISNITTADAGTFQLQVYYGGCSASASTSVSISSVFAPVISVAANNPVCATQTLQLTATNDKPAAAISWTGPNSFSSSLLTPSISGVTVAATGVYQFTASLSGCTSTASIPVTVNPAPPVTSGVSICQGGSGLLTSSTTCSGFVNSGTSLSGSWNGTTDPTAKIPTSADNSTLCSFSTAVRNYHRINFQVSESGTYVFTMNPNASYDGMGYLATGTFVPGNCSGGGSWIVGDDDGSGVSLEPMLTATLSAGVTYSLISTTWSSYSGTYTGTFSWTVTPPDGAEVMLPATFSINWFATSSGGSSLGSGPTFNPIGISGSGLPNSNTPGSTAYYAECSNNAGCRASANFIIYPNPPAPSVSVTQPSCSTSTGTITVSSATAGLNFSINGTDYSNSTGVFTGLVSGSYYVKAKNAQGCISPETAATVNIQPSPPAAPAVSGISVCEGHQGSLFAAAPSGSVVDWYAVPAGGSPVLTGSSSYDTVFNASMTLYAQSRNISSGCLSAARSEALVTVIPKVYSRSVFSACNYFDWNGTSYYSSGPYTYVTTAASGCDSLAILDLTVSNCNTDLRVKLFLEGYYEAPGMNKPVLYDLGMTTRPDYSDSIELDLWSPAALSRDTPDFRKSVMLMSDGTAYAIYPGVTQGRYYYLAVKHRSSLETWSKSPLLFGLHNEYDFTDSLNAAYGNGLNPPMESMGGGKYALFSGDVNQDGRINQDDYGIMENDVLSILFGYYVTDLNGDGEVESYDYSLLENNIIRNIIKARP